MSDDLDFKTWRETHAEAMLTTRCGCSQQITLDNLECPPFIDIPLEKEMNFIPSYKEGDLFVIL